MSPQLRSVLARVLDTHYRGKRDTRYVVGALVRIAGEPNFTTKLAVEAIRAARKMLCEALEGPGDFSELMRDPTKQGIVEEWALSNSDANRRSSGRNRVPLLGEEEG
jgi:hypothetical protein